jgi:two-component system chemotaxis response regulator CheY
LKNWYKGEAVKILIVDDSATLRRILNMGIRNALKDKECEILEAVDGQDGLEMIQNNLDIDYVFLDVNMPVMKGDEMLQIMRNTPSMKDIKVIMQTTEGIREKVKRLTEMGISGYILKPYTQETIYKLITKLLEREAAKA